MFIGGFGLIVAAMRRSRRRFSVHADMDRHENKL
jgi:hypothetical protein